MGVLEGAASAIRDLLISTEAICQRAGFLSATPSSRLTGVADPLRLVKPSAQFDLLAVPQPHRALRPIDAGKAAALPVVDAERPIFAPSASAELRQSTRSPRPDQTAKLPEENRRQNRERTNRRTTERTNGSGFRADQHCRNGKKTEERQRIHRLGHLASRTTERRKARQRPRGSPSHC